MTNPARTCESAVSAKPARRRRRVYIAAAIACGLIPLLSLEAGLRLAGIAEQVSYQDPLVGFSRVSPLFEMDEPAGVYRTSRSHQVLFEAQQFAVDKPERGIRIFCLGGSTVRGRPYTTQTAFPRWLELELSARDPDHRYELVNCGGLSYASYRLAQILEEVLDHQPDLIVVATGHNEFLEDRTYRDIKDRSRFRAVIEDRLHQLRTVRVIRELLHASDAPSPDDERTVLPDLVEARLDQASGYASYHRDDAWAAGVHEHFERSLKTMIDRCRQANVPLLLVLLGSNVRDCPPFKSEHRPGLTLEQEQAWQVDFDRAAAVEASDPQQALQWSLAAARIDDEHALLRFRIGRLLDRLGRPQEAAGHYLAAKDLDVCPLRMPEAFARSLRQIARQTGTPLVDARGLIEARCTANLPGNDWYMDHVHPGIGGHQLIAAALVEPVQESVAAVSLSSLSDDDRRAARERHLQSLGDIYLANGYERVSWLENWARRQRLLDETLPRDPAAHIRYGHREWDFARQDAAWEHYLTALQEDPAVLEMLRDRIGQLCEQGRRAEALRLLDRLAGSGAAPAETIAEIRENLPPQR